MTRKITDHLLNIATPTFTTTPTGPAVGLSPFGTEHRHASTRGCADRIRRDRRLPSPHASANVVQMLGASGMFGSFFLGSLYLERVQGNRPLEIGLAFLPVTVLMGALSVRYTERFVGRLGAQRVLVSGLVLLAGGLALFAIAPVRATYVTDLLPATVLLGTGAGLCFPPMMGLVMTGVEPADAGLASGLVNTTAQVGGAIGLAALSTVSASRSRALGLSGHEMLSSLTGGYHLAFWIAASLIGASVAIALATLRPSAAATVEPSADMDNVAVTASA